MKNKVAIHSFKGGTGKSNLVVNLAVTAAFKGLRVGVADLDFKGPGLDSIFGITEGDGVFWLNDFLSSRCSAMACVIDLTERLGIRNGNLFFTPASLRTEDIISMYKLGYEVDDLTEGLDQVMEELELDLMLMDTHPGLDNDTLYAMIICDSILVLSRLDRQDYVGTAVTLEVLNRLQFRKLKKRVSLIINQVPEAYSLKEVREEFEKTYNHPVVAVIPFYPEVLSNRSQSVFCLERPSHPFSIMMAEIVDRLFGS